MTPEKIKESFSVCGLVCALCSEGAKCCGCRGKTGECSIKKCCQGKSLEYCFMCEEFPCGQEMFKSTRIRAFNRVAGEDGLERLAIYLLRNLEKGIRYHRPDGIKGDYDRLQSEQQVIKLLKDGRVDPYEDCPTYESSSFILRLVSPEDADELLKCYSNPEARRFFNDDKCNFGYGKEETLEEMQEIIRLWLEKYAERSFVRFSIVDRTACKAVGTVEMFGGDQAF